jgi:uridine phosphorylase
MDDRPGLPLEEFDGHEEGMLQPRPLVVDGTFPPAAVVCFFAEAARELHDAGGLFQIGQFSEEMGGRPIYATPDRAVAVFHPGVGGPLSAHSLEQAIASGARRIIAVGGAGSLVESFGQGDVLVVETAVRDEGTSFHYLPPSRTVHFDTAETQRLAAGLANLGVPSSLGTTWTTDADFRETRTRIERRRAEGCVAVEMEAASLAAVSRFRGIQHGHLLYSGDSLHGPEWTERSWTTSTRRAQLLEAGITLSRA